MKLDEDTFSVEYMTILFLALLCFLLGGFYGLIMDGPIDVLFGGVGFLVGSIATRALTGWLRAREKS